MQVTPPPGLARRRLIAASCALLGATAAKAQDSGEGSVGGPDRPCGYRGGAHPKRPWTHLTGGSPEAQRAREDGIPGARCHIERLLAAVPSHCGLVTVLDGHPATHAWLGSVRGQRVVPLGVDHFGQAGDIPDLYREYGLDTDSILDACAQALLSD